MKRILSFFVLSLLLLPLVLSFSSNAAEKIYFDDKANLVSKEEAAEINRLLTEFSKSNKFDLIIVDVKNDVPFSMTSYADDYYDNNNYGYGSNRDGALLLVNVNSNGKYSKGNSYISTCGSGIDKIDQSKIREIGEILTPMLLNGNYSEAFKSFPRMVQEEFKKETIKMIMICLLVGIILGIIVAIIYSSSLKKQLKNVQDATDANNNVVKDSLVIVREYDHFMYANVSRVRIASDSSSSSGTHTSSSGTSHGGGGF